jgi:hypothetical protein
LEWFCIETNRVQPCRSAIACAFRELPRGHRARAQVARLAGSDDVVERLHRLLERRVRVEAVDLVEVDVVEAEPLERRVDCRQNVLARESPAVRARRGGMEDLRGDERLLP